MKPELIVALIAGLAVWTYVVAGVSEKEIERQRIASQSSGLFFGILLGVVAAGALQLISEIAEAEWVQSYMWPLGIIVCCVAYGRSVRRFVHGEPALRARLAARAVADRAALVAPRPRGSGGLISQFPRRLLLVRITQEDRQKAGL